MWRTVNHLQPQCLLREREKDLSDAQTVVMDVNVVVVVVVIAVVVL